MRIIGLDPGPSESALVLWDGKIEFAMKQPNEFVLKELVLRRTEPLLVIEQIASFGMPVGEEVFETVFWSGRFAEAFGMARVGRLKRLDVKMRLCHDSRAKDANIRQALIDRLGAPGTKKKPGPTFGMAGDLWSALAVAVAWQEPT